MTRFLAAGLVAVSVACCRAPGQLSESTVWSIACAAQDPQAQPTEMEYELMRSLLATFAAKSSRRVVFVLDTEELGVHGMEEALAPPRDTDEVRVLPATIDALRAAAGGSFRLKREKFEDLSIDLMSQDELSARFDEASAQGDAWALLRGAPVVRVSRAGIHCQAGEAAIYLSMDCGSLCGYGWRVILRREANGWVEVGRSMLWVS